MNTAIVIGTFSLKSFIRLNILQTKSIFDSSPILLADDRSEHSDEIRRMAEEFECAYCCSKIQRGHFSGDMQAIISGLSFAEQEGADILLKLSQRLIPVLPVFREYVEKPFEDSKINIVVPGRISAGQINLPSSKFFSSFGLLTDVIAIRIGSISPQELLDKYHANFKFGRFSPNVLVEVFFGQLLATHFQNAAYVSSSLGNHNPMEPMAFLRKAQSTPNNYAHLAKLHGIENGEYDTRELSQIFGRAYLSRPVLVT